MTDHPTTAVRDFLAHKRALGRKYLTEEATLRLFVAFAERHGVEALAQLTPTLVDDFIASRARARARSFNHLVGILGCFLDWAVAQQRLDGSPLRRARRRETAQAVPFIFDPAQARRLLEAAAALPDNPRAAGRGPIYHAIFALCYGLGLRAGGACGLRRHDVDTGRQLLVVRGGKFERAASFRMDRQPPLRAPRLAQPGIPPPDGRAALSRPRRGVGAHPALAAPLLRRRPAAALVSRWRPITGEAVVPCCCRPAESAHRQVIPCCWRATSGRPPGAGVGRPRLAFPGSTGTANWERPQDISCQ